MPGAICILLSILLSSSISEVADADAGIGVNYGKQATSLPSPTQVAQFLAHNTIVNRVKLFDTDTLTLQAFANTGLAVDVTVPNGLVPRMANLGFAQQWVRSNIVPYAQATNISRILVGNEVISQANKTLLLTLVPAMQNLHTALVSVSLNHKIKVSSPHSLGILSTSTPPSAGKFHDGYDVANVKPLLSFLRATNSSFMVNAYPFYGFTANTLDFALFRINSGVMDNDTGLVYANMLDGQLDAVHSAMKRLGFGDVDIVIAETGWPSAGEEWEVGVGADFARDYNKNVIRHLGSGVGTPLMPNRTFEASIYSLFNENLKPGPASEKNFGLFHADMTPVYDIGILSTSAQGIAPATSKATPTDPKAANVRQWCVPKPTADEMVLQDSIDFVCGQGIDCSPIRPGGICYDPDTVMGHAAYAMNEYFQSNGRHAFDCDFGQTGVITTADPSYGSCKFT